MQLPLPAETETCGRIGLQWLYLNIRLLASCAPPPPAAPLPLGCRPRCCDPRRLSSVVPAPRGERGVGFLDATE